MSAEALSIAANAPIGTTIYEETVNVPEAILTCTTNEMKGFYINSNLVSWGPTDYSFVLGKTGLSFNLFRYQPNGAEFFEKRPASLQPRERFTLPIKYRIRIYKSSEIQTQQLVPAGLLGSIKWGGLELVKVSLAKPITLNAASCQTPAVALQMGDDYELFEFDRVGDTPRTIKFNIALKECQSGIKKVNYSIKANTQVIDQQKGIVALDSSSTAKGIGLKLMNEAGQSIALDTTYTFNGFNTTDTNFNIPLSAAYYRLAGGQLEAGTANTSVTFIMSYL